MYSKKEITKAAQRILAEQGLYDDKIDGVVGNNTLNGLAQAEGVPEDYSTSMKMVAAIQIYLNKLEFNAGTVDGLWGETTESALEDFNYWKLQGERPSSWRPEDISLTNPNNWPKAYTPEFEAFFGEGGSSQLEYFDFPYAMRLAWSPYSKVTRTRCHKKVKDSAIRVLQQVKDHYGVDQIEALGLNVFGGCYNYRSIRGGTKLSMHSWGVAFDFDPANNKLKWGRDRARFAEPIYDKWWELWEDEGWISLGRQRNFDWMHVQAASI